MQTVGRLPQERIVMPGSGLDRPQAKPRKVKLETAAVIDQCNSASMVNSTTPSEVKVAMLRKKNASETAPNMSHLPSGRSWTGMLVMFLPSRAKPRIPTLGDAPRHRLA